jgi:Zn-dependent protease
MVVALAGPAVNVVVAAALFAWLAMTRSLEPLSALGLASGSVVERLMVANLGLVVFNLLPVFPLDGGRVLRAALALRMPYPRATAVAARIGKAGAVLLGVYGLFSSPLTVLVAVFIWLAATEEARAVAARHAGASYTLPGGVDLLPPEEGTPRVRVRLIAVRVARTVRVPGGIALLV